MERLSYRAHDADVAEAPVTVVAMRARTIGVARLLSDGGHPAVRRMRARRVTLLHVGDPVLAPLAMIARAFGVPTVVTVHGLDVVYGSVAYRIWRRLFLRGFDRYVCISEATRAAAIGAGVPAVRTSVIGVGSTFQIDRRHPDPAT